MTPKQYRKKPVVIEAMRPADSPPGDVFVWLEENGCPALIGNALEPETLRTREDPDAAEPPANGWYIDPANGALMIRTLEGDMRADVGDWIIRGVQGEFYPCKPDIFADTYDEVTP